MRSESYYQSVATMKDKTQRSIRAFAEVVRRPIFNSQEKRKALFK